jgi:hypothetical protein
LDLDTAVKAVELMLPELAKVTTFADQAGGAFCLVSEATGQVLMGPRVVGTAYLTEQGADEGVLTAMALAEHRKSTEGQKTWLSREIDGAPAGAVSDGQHIWSFVGLEPGQNEALMIMAAHISGQLMNGVPEAAGNAIINAQPYLFWYRPGEVKAAAE